MEQPIPHYSTPRRSLTHTPPAKDPIYVKQHESGRRARNGGDRAADLLAALALPLLVLGLVVSRLSLGIVGRRQRDKHDEGRVHDRWK